MRKIYTNNPSREKDKPLIRMLGLTINKWYQSLSADERRKYREVWKQTEEQDRQLPPGAWQLKYLGCMFIPPALPKGPEYLSDGHGNMLVRRPDGTEETTLWREEVKITTHPNGKREIVMERGGERWSQIALPSGNRIQRRSDCGGRYIMQTELPNGIIITSTYDGRLLREYPCGVSIIETADGRVEMQKGDELTELAPPVPAWKDVQRNRRAQFAEREEDEQ